MAIMPLPPPLDLSRAFEKKVTDKPEASSISPLKEVLLDIVHMQLNGMIDEANIGKTGSGRIPRI